MMKSVLFLLCLILSPLIGASEKITIYSQYDYPPFWSEGHGLTADLAQKLTELSQDKYQFVVEIIPRKRLDAMMQSPKWQGIVPWANPSWFGDEQQSRFIWSSTLFMDADLVVSNQPINFAGPESLYGKRLGGILGHRYIELEQDIAAGKIIRDDAPSQSNNLKKLMTQRVDVVFIPHSSWIDLQQTAPESIKGLFLAATPRNRYERRLLISPNNPALAQYISKTLESMSRDSSWQYKIKAYNFGGAK
ncbi:transporter substrate-binding domain-containing protein [Chitinibacter bivalviorum]|uniref:Transporter substrate-binding domain-containing protein n=1 Tax=Chitinibacter bivalviorum TaxID=2739434 RepID=A0A7H9BKQ4_9NEIS|nr:transporter substrate-binding domain-containing protein [Chitinibacter bivalviorum]QLG88591.1 transporter substrate-binding domain-containing protein [Chitinibacter bivalviorum]